MAYSYSLGVIFNTEIQAKDFKTEFERQKFQLKDLTDIGISISLNNTVYDNSDYQHFAVSCFVQGLSYPSGDSQLFEIENFYRIRDSMYDFLVNYNGDFNYALYELEGADKILTGEIKSELKTYGIGKIESGDKNASYCSENEPQYYYSKRLSDGLIVSESVYPKVQTDFPEFTEFKKGYCWLPIPNYKN